MTDEQTPAAGPLTTESVKLLQPGDRLKWLAEREHYGTFLHRMDDVSAGICWHSDTYGRKHYSPGFMMEFVKRPAPPKEDLGDGLSRDVEPDEAYRPHVPSPASSSSVVQGDASGVEREYTDAEILADTVPADLLDDEVHRLDCGPIAWGLCIEGASGLYPSVRNTKEGAAKLAARLAEQTPENPPYVPVALFLRPQPSGETREAVAAIAAERQRQVDVEGWTLSHDDLHDKGEMAKAAGCYAIGSATVGWPIPGIGSKPDFKAAWPWDRSWWKPKGRRSDLVRAGALIVAEIERLDRLALIRPAPVASSDQPEQGGGVEVVAWPVVTDQWAETYCELIGKNPDGQHVNFVDGGVVCSFRDMAKREIEAMMCAADKSTVRQIGEVLGKTHAPDLAERLFKRAVRLEDFFGGGRPDSELLKEASNALEILRISAQHSTPAEPAEARVGELEREVEALTKALTGLTCGGSEFFTRKGERFVADIPACVDWVRRSRHDAHRRTVDAIKRATAAEAQLAKAKEALERMTYAAASVQAKMSQTLAVQGSEWREVAIPFVSAIDRSRQTLAAFQEAGEVES